MEPIIEICQRLNGIIFRAGRFLKSMKVFFPTQKKIQYCRAENIHFLPAPHSLENLIIQYFENNEKI